MKLITVLYLLVCLLGALCVLFTVYWLQNWRGGFARDESGLFNWHPVCMVTGMVVIYGAVLGNAVAVSIMVPESELYWCMVIGRPFNNKEKPFSFKAALVYRLPVSRVGSKLPWKLLHAGLTLTAFVLSVLGLVAVFTFHNQKEIPNLYSLHSWLGLAAVLLFSCQWISGFSTFLLPLAPNWIRSAYKPLHLGFGSAIFVLSVAAAIAGINEKLIFSLPKNNVTQAYSELPPEALFANSLGLLIGVFGLLVLWMLSRPSWQYPDRHVSEAQQPLLEDEDAG